MASVTGICNRALQKLGAKRITDISDDSVNARACNAAYESVRDSELRKHRWNFAIGRTELAADSPAPTWGRANAFTLPSDCLKVIPPYPEMNMNDLDWVIEGRKILSNDSAPLYLRYIKQVTDANTMDAAFREALATSLAYELCEELSQSTTKKQELKDDYKAIVNEAKKANGIEVVPQESSEDSWITGRS